MACSAAKLTTADITEHTEIREGVAYGVSRLASELSKPIIVNTDTSFIRYHLNPVLSSEDSVSFISLKWTKRYCLLQDQDKPIKLLFHPRVALT